MRRMALIGAVAAIALVVVPTVQAAFVEGTDLSTNTTFVPPPRDTHPLTTNTTPPAGRYVDQPVVAQRPSVVTSPSEGFNWGDAAIGALSGLGVALLFAGGALLALNQHTKTRIATH